MKAFAGKLFSRTFTITLLYLFVCGLPALAAAGAYGNISDSKETRAEREAQDSDRGQRGDRVEENSQPSEKDGSDSKPSATASVSSSYPPVASPKANPGKIEQPAAENSTLVQGRDTRRGWGYGLFGVGGSTDGGVTLLYVGGGGEGLIHKGLGIGADLGYLAPKQALGDGVGIFSPNLSYHFAGSDSSGKAVPFVTGGYSLLFRTGTLSGFNYGGGITYWMHDRVGLRMEFRGHYFPAAGGTNLLGARVGIAFR